MVNATRCSRDEGMIGSSGLIKSAIAVAAIGLVVGVGRPSGGPAPVAARPTVAPLGLGSASDAQARRLRRVTRALGRELSAAARCEPRRFDVCVTPALRRAGIGGRTTAMFVRGVMAGVSFGACRDYLYGLQAANDAAGDDARWLLPLLYERPHGPHQREILSQMALAGQMLRRAARAASVRVCSLSADVPAG
jgi:hypothetical protein